MQLRIHLEELETFAKSLRSARFSYQKVGDGLLLVGYKEYKKRLASKLLVKNRTNYMGKLQDLVKNTLSILDNRLNENSLIIDSFHYKRSAESYLLLGMTPLFWWPIDLDFIKGIIFQNIHVTTIYNPAHFIVELKNRGFDIKFHLTNIYFELSKKTINRKYHLEGVPYFINLIKEYFFYEDYVIQMIEQFIKKIELKQIEPGTKVELAFYQQFIN